MNECTTDSHCRVDTTTQIKPDVLIVLFCRYDLLVVLQTLRLILNRDANPSLCCRVRLMME